MNLLLIGSGGREHALAWKLKQSPRLDQLFVAPGNAGIEAVATCVALDIADHGAVARFCKDNDIGLVIVGPEAPLVAGLTDDLEAEGLIVFGPSRAAAQLEGSKGFTKDLCARANIPTAVYARFSQAAPAKAYLAGQPLPIVIKADGLAAGKGVVIAETKDEAEAAIDACFSGAFGDAGAELVIEEFLRGEEASFFVLVDGQTVLPLITAQDHKRAFDGDQGPNTGGMGAYSPLDELEPGEISDMAKLIFPPVLKRLAESGTPFRGLLYAGLMLTPEGVKVLEFNCRFGDPEVQAVIPTVSEDPLEMMLAVAEGRLVRWELDHRVTSVDWRKLSNKKHAVSVVVAAEGYPSDYQKGMRIEHLPDETGDVITFHADTTIKGGKLVTSGGRVLAVTGIGSTHEDAVETAYIAVEEVDFKGLRYRKDIGRSIG